MKKYLLYQKQIAGFKDLEETVKVVEKAAASQIHFLKKRVSTLSEYKSGIKLQLGRFLEFSGEVDHPLLAARKAGERALLVIAGDRGIVGGLYHELVNQFLVEKSRYQKVFVLGRKAKEYLSEEKVSVEQFVYSEFLARFQGGRFRSVDILYPQFVSLAEQRPARVRFLPFKMLDSASPFGRGEGWPIFEPSKEQIFDSLLQKYIGVFFREITLEAQLSEFSARTVTAEHAASKTKEIRQSLRLSFLKERRTAITQKQLESFVVHETV
jgi:ATP synthase F1 gamma subunit